MMIDNFPIVNSLIYLNHAALAPLPLCAQQAATTFVSSYLPGVSTNEAWYSKAGALKALFSWLINADNSDDIAILKNTSEGLSVIAYGLDWQPGDNVVCAAQEFPSNRVVWQSLQRLGVETRLADLSAHPDAPESALLELIDDRTRLVSVSSIQYADGLRMDLPVLGNYCREHGVLFCVDAIQSLGALPFDIHDCHADFVVADGHKWMLGPEGVALFYSSEAARQQLSLTQYGWYMLKDLGNYDRMDWEIARDARRFECGSLNMLGIHTLHASLSLLQDISMESVQQSVLNNSERIIRFIEEHSNYQLITPADPRRHGGIVTFRHRQLDAQHLYKSLQENQVVCALRGGGLRFSPHFYTPESQLEQAFSLLDELG
jgi:selenocysteine lyase/cysteine desulfurase